MLSAIGWKFIRLHLSEASTEAKDPEILSGNFRQAVYSLAVLDDKGLAAGTSGSTVDLFNVSALQPDGPRDPSQQFQADGRVFP